MWCFLSTTANYTVINNEPRLKKQTIFKILPLILIKVVRHTCQINNLKHFNNHYCPRNALNILKTTLKRHAKNIATLDFLVGNVLNI